MGSPDQPAASSTAAPADQRKCVKCNESKTVTPESWPYRKSKGPHGIYSAYGGVCMVCERKRRAEYEARRNKFAALVADVPSGPATGKPEDKDRQKTALAATKLDVAKALKAGSKVLNEYAPGILARVIEYAEDPHHEHHLWAVQLLAERILPRKLYEELGAVAAGVGSLQDKRPQFVIQVLPAQPAAPEGRVIEGEATVLALESKP